MITVCTTTLRKEPRFKETADSLVAMVKPNIPWEWLIIDGILWTDPHRREALAHAVDGRLSYRHLEPKPSLWQGPTRLTSKDHWDACSARNTAFITAKYNYVVFIDDCMKVDEGWFFQIIRAAQQNLAFAGTYVSVGADGVPVPDGGDHRKKHCPESQLVAGGWLYGMNMGVPLTAALKVDGYDEMYGGARGVEDSDFGIRLERAGCKTLWMPESIVYQLMDSHEGICEPAVRPKERKLKNGMIRFANEFLTERLTTQDVNRYLPLLPRNLTKLRQMYWNGESLPVPTAPTRDWRDGQSLREM